MYQCAENAYGTLDYSGAGHITEEAFLNSIILKDRVPFSPEQVQTYFKEFNLFNS